MDPSGRYIYVYYAYTVDVVTDRGQSVDLTRLPSVTHATPEPATKGFEKVESKPAVEYSSREVSPPALLTQQLLQAHYVFLLHHGPSLSELFVRLSRDKFCNALERFWTRFCKTWDVLLHGNPATDVFSGLKLASGGELGMGVGEEEWGSGEREVLEDLAQRTEGLVDLVVSRFGEPATAIASDDETLPESEALPWMGSLNRPIASDGVVFGGIGRVSRHSLRDVSLWMRQIYTYGEYAYGVRDNPLRERRKRRRRNPPEASKDMDDGAAAPQLDVEPKELRRRVQRKEAAKQHEGSGPLDPSILPPDPRPQIYGRTASQDHAAASPAHTPPPPVHDRPGVPPPIASAAEQALDKATQKADANAEQEQKEEAGEEAAAGTTMGIPDQYMKYLTFGLSELGRSSRQSKRPPMQMRTSSPSSMTIKPPRRSDNATKAAKKAATDPIRHDRGDQPVLTYMDPMPEGESLKAKIAHQKRQENKGHFVVGLTGDLDTMSLEEDDDGTVTEGSFHNDTGGSRTVVRTLQVEIPPKPEEASEEDEDVEKILQRKAREADDPDAEPENTVTKSYKRVRVLVYVHRPFMYCFLFENRTSSLAYSGFYKELHRNLLPIHKPLLSSTNVAKVAQRIESSHAEAEEDAASIRSAGTNRLPSKGAPAATPAEQRPIFDLIYDPRLLTVHTSIPNIPEPGTPAAEGLAITGARSESSTPADWTRIEALNVHSQVLNTLRSVKGRREEIERTSKTSRGWWVVWMRVPPSAPSAADGLGQTEAGSSTVGIEREAEADSVATLRNEAAAASSDNLVSLAKSTPRTTAPFRHQRAVELDMSRTAFLVRKSSDTGAGAGASTISSAGSRVASGMWSSLGWRSVSVDETAGGASAGWGPAALTGGIGIDARRYVEGLLSLNR